MVMVLLGAAIHVGLHSFFLYRRLDLELLPTYLEPRYIEKNDDDDNDDDADDNDNGMGCL